MSIAYNHLNLPTRIIFDTDDEIEYLYDATGTKLKKIVTDGSTATTTEYLDGFQYTNGALDFFPHAEGYVQALGYAAKKGTGPPPSYIFRYIFTYTDHLGNVRLKYAQDPGNGNALAILEENHYYPFGLQHKGYNGDHRVLFADLLGGNVSLVPVTPYYGDRYKYKFGGKEYSDELGLNSYDFGARNYDPALGRWMNMDPLAELMRRHSPYNYAFNNPIFFIDPDGMMPMALSSGSGLGLSDSTTGFDVTTFDSDGKGVDSQFVTNLNDVAIDKGGNISSKNDFNKEVDAAFGDKADSAAPASKETINDVVNGVPTLKDKYEKYEGKHKFAISPAEEGSNGDKAMTFGYLDNPDRNPHTTVFQSAFKSYRFLAGVLFHEFIHVDDFIVTGQIYKDYYNLCNIGCSPSQARTGAGYLSEIRAYSLGKQVTGQPYTFGYIEAARYLKQNGISY